MEQENLCRELGLFLTCVNTMGQQPFSCHIGRFFQVDDFKLINFVLTTDVVPSPTSWSCKSASSTSTLAAGCSTSKSFNIVAPSLVTVTS